MIQCEPNQVLRRGMMIVDDATDVRDLLQSYFTTQGYNVSAAQNGLEALNTLKEARELPELIFLDLMMPVMDGLEFRRKQENEAKLSDIPIIVLSADAHVEKKAKEIGADGYLKKPMNLNQIQSLVERYCSKSGEGPGATFSSRKIDALVSAIQKLSLARSLDEVTVLARSAAREIAGSDGATIVLREDDLCHYVDEDAIGPLWKGKRFPMKTCISGWTMLNREVAVIEDVYSDKRIPIDAYRPTFVKSLVMVPIRADQPMGAIGSYWREKHRPSDQEIEMLKALANSTSIALENIARIHELERANESLRKTLAAREEFLSVAAHELRTPLTPLKLQLQIAEKQISSGLIDAGLTLDLSLRQLESLSGLIENLLDVSRIRMDRMTVDPSSFDFAEAVVQATERMLPQLHDSRCRIEFDLTRDLVGMWDRLRVEQIVTNLLSNCCKYAAGTRVQVTLSRTSRDSVLLSVKDEGPGIPEEAHDRIFTRFERAGPHVKVSGGFGLGLYIVKKIVEAHKGTITVASEAGKGTEFMVELPIRS